MRHNGVNVGYWAEGGSAHSNRRETGRGGRVLKIRVELRGFSSADFFGTGNGGQNNETTPITTTVVGKSNRPQRLGLFGASYGRGGLWAGGGESAARGGERAAAASR